MLNAAVENGLFVLVNALFCQSAPTMSSITVLNCTTVSFSRCAYHVDSANII